jgi:hypothetical protein
MPKVTWSEAMVRFPAGHLVVGILDEDLSGTPRKGYDALATLLRRLRPKGDYALTISRAKGRMVIHCVFENESDARRVSEALQADVIGRYPGWASQREFTLDGKTIQTIERALREVK